MTNEMIIFGEQMRLLKEGKINATGRTLVLQNIDGSKTTMPEPEAIHTFACWKELGYCVMKGQKSVASFAVWKRTSRVNKETGEEETNMFLKTSSFFARHQVEAIA